MILLCQPFSSSGLGLRSLRLLNFGPLPGQQLIDPVDRMILDAREHIDQVAERVDLIHPAVLNNGVDHGRGLPRF